LEAIEFEKLLYLAFQPRKVERNVVFAAKDQGDREDPRRLRKMTAKQGLGCIDDRLIKMPLRQDLADFIIFFHSSRQSLNLTICEADKLLRRE
jgi:hypothetical protein